MTLKFGYFAITLFLFGTPTNANDLLAAGKALFEENCVECHGEDAREGSSGDIRDIDMRQIKMAIGGVEDMPEFELGEEELEALLAYLHSLR